MNTVTPVSSIEAPILLPCGDSASIRELIAHHRAALTNLGPVERGRLHLTIGAYLGKLGADSRDEAIEELRQAIDLLSEEHSALDHAAARLHFGTLLLERTTAHAVADRVAEARSAGGDAAYHLERAYRGFVAFGPAMSRVESARWYANALPASGRFNDVYPLLEREQLEHKGEHRRWLQLFLADHSLGDPDPRRQKQGAEILASCFTEIDGIPHGADDFVISLVGFALPYLPGPVLAQALEWMEKRIDVPTSLRAALRAKAYPNEPGPWIEKDDQSSLVATMDDANRPISKRVDAGYHLLGLLPNDEVVVRRRAAELLDEWIDSPEVHPAKRATYRHDLGVAMKLVAKGDSKWLDRAVRHLQQAYDDLKATSTRPIAAGNLARALLALLEVRSSISSPEIVAIAAAINVISAGISREEAREFHLASATELLHLDMFSHPICVEAAGLLIEEVLKGRPNDADAHRLRYWHARIRRDQGLVDAEDVERLLVRARKLGPVTDEKPSKEHELNAAKAFAGNGLFETVDLGFAVGALRVRPDVTETILNEIQHRLHRPGLTLAEKNELLDYAVTAVAIVATGDMRAYGKKLAALLLENRLSIGKAKIARVARKARGPAAEAMRDELESHGISFGTVDDSEDESDLTTDERAMALRGKGIALMDSGRERLSNRDLGGATRLFEQASKVWNEACKLARSLDDSVRATIQISAGNARRWLARAKPSEQIGHLDAADALYVEAWPWTEKQPDLRAQLAKVRADALLLRKDDARWGEIMELYRVALDGRTMGFLRWETLHEVAKAELVCPSRPRTANTLAALSRLDEALAHVSADDTARTQKTAKFMLSLLQRLKGQIRDIYPKAAHYAARIIRAAPDLEPDVRMAIEGLDGMHGGLSDDGTTRGDLELLESDFFQTYLNAVAEALPPRGLENVPPHLREMMSETPEAKTWERRGGDAQALKDAATQLAKLASHENHETRAGRLIARARIYHRLQEFGEDVHEARIAACADGEAASRAILHDGIRGQAFVELARAWQIVGPKGNFVKSLQLLDEAISLVPVDWQIVRCDLLGCRARAIRYREDIPTNEAVQMAISAYREAETQCRATGNAEGLAQTLKNLAEALCAREDRPRATALRDGIVVEREAMRIARDARIAGLAEYLHNCAYTLLLLAQCSEIAPEDRKTYMEESKALFDEATRVNTDHALGRMIENNRLNWLAYSAQDGDREPLIAALRARLIRIDPVALPLDWAMAAHNLGNELFERFQSDADLKEAYGLLGKALVLRPLRAGAQFHWETASRLGQLLAFLHGLGLRKRANLASFGLTLSSSRAQAIELLRSAMTAARQIGQGRALVRTAKQLGPLSADVMPGEMPDLALAAEAMTALDEVLSLVPEDRQAGETEAEVAAAIASALALHRAKTAAVQAVTSTGATALHGGAAWEVLHWMLRAHGGQHRRLRARMAKPDGVSPETWTLWRLALRKQDNWDERKRAFQAVRTECSSFLSGEPNLSATMDWLKTSGGAAAMLLETPRGWLLGVLTSRADGAADASVVLLRAEPPPFALPDFLQLLRAPAMNDARKDASEKAQKALDDTERWIRVNVLPDLRERLPENCPMLLWSPHGLAAGVSFGMVWNDLPSIWTTPCLTRPPPTIAPDVRSSSLLVLAEPSDAPTIDGAETMARIARGLRDSKGRVEALFGQGRDTGLDVAGVQDVPGLLNVAPTPNEVKRRLADHRLVVILAHGQFDDVVPERSALALIGPEGKMELLTAESLAEMPDLLRGSIVVLLSCETGAAGALSAAPAGLAGVLLAVGAAAVVAPLWIVFRDVALLIGEHLAADIAHGYDIGKALKWATEKARLKNADSYHAGPFVLWTG